MKKSVHDVSEHASTLSPAPTGGCGRGVSRDLAEVCGEPLSSSARLATLTKLHFLPRKGGERCGAARVNSLPASIQIEVG